MLSGKSEEKTLKSLKSQLGKDRISKLPIDEKIVSKIFHRVRLATNIANDDLEKAKQGRDEKWMQEAAEELGDESSTRASNRHSNRTASWRNELQVLLNQKLTVGFSSKYITGGHKNMAAQVLSGKNHSLILGASTQSAYDDIK